jgi:hypothetical protein
MNTVQTIGTTVVAGLFLTAIIFIAKSLFGTRPRLRVRILPEMSGSYTGSRADKIRCTWEKRLEIYNSTPFNALNVTFIWPDPSRRLPVPQLEPPHVNATETRSLGFKIEKEFSREEVVACRDRFKELLPAELKTISLILRYHNDKGIAFYTRYERNGDVENSTFHRFKPKL